MQHPHAYHNDNTPCPAYYYYHCHYHFSYLAHHNFENTDAFSHPYHPLKHLVHAEYLHPHNLYVHYPHHHHHNQHPHYHALPTEKLHDVSHTDQAGHVLHFKRIIATSDITKSHWVWHITDHNQTVIKTSEHIHNSFEDCARDARHQDTKLIIEHKNIEKTSWAWVITDHHGVLIKKSTTIHATFIKCIEDLHHHHGVH